MRVIKGILEKRLPRHVDEIQHLGRIDLEYKIQAAGHDPLFVYQGTT